MGLLCFALRHLQIDDVHLYHVISALRSPDLNSFEKSIKKIIASASIISSQM